ncbi:ABC-2 type transport system ATP-binding protein [Mesobacillus persicus]|uniref:ABC-2 type transport system ATP-binding protein n=1 Tax=Mesobacillus persicus TaxID=930146 RepID=A0A1H7ZMG6_9BACI|nr:ABC transporter ATP-binding protein [Mesobacillus persicus]SEM59762.1 ABC-2 type transport system ATP-binding protein [Mesobacillus persicus]
MGTVLEVTGVSKQYRNGRGIKDLHLSLEQGNVMGLIGPNGAGKTTLMKCITGLVQPSGGRIIIFGREIGHDYKEAIRPVGVYIGMGTMYPHLSPYQNLKMALRFYPELGDSRIDEVLEQVGLLQFKRDIVSSFSLGMNQRLGLAAALLSKPSLVILDEPANGLDIDGMLLFRKIVEQLSAEGVTFLISSHLTGELERICSHFSILIGGELKFTGPTESLGKGKSIEDHYVERLGGNFYAPSNNDQYDE